jgi:hypothetical protein
MPLLKLWESNPHEIRKYNIQQIVAMSGDGQLRDGSECARELRTFIAQTDLAQLESYVARCLQVPFTDSGFVLQDLVNELGRRLDYQVTNGRYSGVVGQIGFDGIWLAPDGHQILVEVKTTDAYRVSLDTIAKYRSKLIAEGTIAAQSSVLLIVGRQETGELEAQIRGSRHAWDMRLISIDALVKLTKLKQDTDDPETAEKIRAILIPFEYTKLDQLVDVMFATARDASSVPEDEPASDALEAVDAPSEQPGAREYEFTDPKLLDKKREEIVAGFSAAKSLPLVKKSRAVYWTPSRDVRVVCTLSKRYTRPGQAPYWYAFHPKWQKFFEEGKEAYFIVGGMDLDHAYAIPSAVLFANLQHMNVTQNSDRMYWHIKLLDRGTADLALQLPKIDDALDLTPYRFSIA